MARAVTLLERYRTAVPVGIFEVALRAAAHVDAGWTMPGEPVFALALPVTTLGNLTGVLAFVPPMVVVAWEDNGSFSTVLIETGAGSVLEMALVTDAGGALIVDLPDGLGFLSPIGTTQAEHAAASLVQLYPGSLYH